MITKSMLIEKDVWDLVVTGPRPERQNPGLFTKEVKEDRMAVGIARRIILEGVSGQLPLKAACRSVYEAQASGPFYLFIV